MPHCILEYARPLEKSTDIKKILKKVHETVENCRLFSPDDIKSRAVAYDYYFTGIHADAAEFVHVTIYILAGRNSEQKKQLSHSVVQTLFNELPFVHSLTVDIQEMERNSYAKMGRDYGGANH